MVPVYNEEKSLLELHNRIFKEIQHNYVFEYIYIDDCSVDASFNQLLQLKHTFNDQKITLVKFRKHLGKSAALAVGFSCATGDIVITLDADLQDDPSEIPRLIQKIEEGFHVVSSWRSNRHDFWQKILLSKIFNYIVGVVTGVKLHDFNSGLKAYSCEVVKEISLYGELHRYIPVLAVSCGFSVCEIQVKHHKRKYGTSKYGTRRVFQAGFDFLATWFLIRFKERPMQLFGMTGAIAIVVGCIVLTYLSYLHFMNMSIGTRPLLTLGVLLVLFGVQLVSTGFLAELFTHYNHSPKSYPIDKIIR